MQEETWDLLDNCVECSHAATWGGPMRRGLWSCPACEVKGAMDEFGSIIQWRVKLDFLESSS